jgi:hypothetical protein
MFGTVSLPTTKFKRSSDFYCPDLLLLNVRRIQTLLLAREGKQVMQFLEAGRYIAVVVDGKVHTYK